MNKSKMKTSRSIKSGMPPTKERRRQNGGVYSEVIDRDADGKVFMTRYRAVCSSPLDACLHFNAINDLEHKAGLKFQEAYYGTVMARRYDLRPVSATQASMERTMSERIIDTAYASLSIDEMLAVIDTCGHDLPVTNLKYLEKLRKGLGKLAIAWHSTAIETCEHKTLT